MVQNLFGSITVLLDRTFTVGDWIKVDDQEGSVEALGTLRVNGSPATLDMRVQPGATILIIPKIEGGLSA